MANIIKCLQSQTLKDFEVIFVVDKKLKNLKNSGEIGNNDILSDFLSDLSEERIGNKLGLNIRFITDVNSSLVPGGNASYVRNYGIQSANGDMIQLMDDDEQFDPDYLQKSLDLRHQYRKEVGKDFVLTPTLMYRQTSQIQNQGFAYFSYWLSRPIPAHLGNKKFDYIQLYSGNSLLAPAHIFKSVKFDNDMDFVYEDMDFTYRIHKAGYPIIVLKDLKIYHMERDKTILEQARVGHPMQAYKKSKHRILFVRKNGNLIQKIEFYLLGLRAQPLRLVGKVLRYGHKEKWKIIHAMWKGFRDGFRN